MTVEADAMARAVRQAGQAIARSLALAGVEGAHRIVIPWPDFSRDAQRLAHGQLFKSRRDDDSVAIGCNDRSDHAGDFTGNQTRPVSSIPLKLWRHIRIVVV